MSLVTPIYLVSQKNTNLFLKLVFYQFYYSDNLFLKIDEEEQIEIENIQIKNTKSRRGNS